MAILKLKLELTDDAVLPLTIGGSVEEQRAVEARLLSLAVEGAPLGLKLHDRVDEVLDGQVRVADDVLSVVLVERDGHIEQLFPPGLIGVHHLVVRVRISKPCGDVVISPRLAELEHFLNVVIFPDHVGVDRVHRDLVVVKTLLVQSLFVELQVVALQDLILVKRERVLDGNVLNVFVSLGLGLLLVSWVVII